MRVAENPTSDREDGLSFAGAFSPALLDPQSETPTIVAGPRQKAAVKRYNVYRNNVTVSLIDALAAIFPATQRITGVEFFRAMARFYVRTIPPTSPLLFEYGRNFSFLYRTLRICPSDAVVGGCGAPGAGLARRLSCSRWGHVSAGSLGRGSFGKARGHDLHRPPVDQDRSLKLCGCCDLRSEPDRRPSRSPQCERTGRRPDNSTGSGRCRPARPRRRRGISDASRLGRDAW